MKNISELKWNKLLSRVWVFNFIPFVELVFVAGSMAMGTISEGSDFDVIVGVKKGRIFMARFCCVLFFGLLGWRRGKNTNDLEVKNKFCFSHFITSEKYCLSGPYNSYWKKLYSSLVPVYGNIESIQRFYDDNAEWMGEKRIYKTDKKHLYKKIGFLKGILEKLLSGKIGNFLEKRFKNIQIKKIEKSLKIENLYKPRITYNDKELEFHPDTGRIEEMLNS